MQTARANRRSSSLTGLLGSRWREKFESAPDLQQVIERLRLRWRLRLLLDGLFWALLLAVGLILVESWLLAEWHFAVPAVWLLRGLTVFAFVGLLMWFCLRPLRRRVSDAQVALYLEEHEPELNSILLSAADASRSRRDDESPQLVEALIQRALEASAGVDYGDAIERAALRRAGLKIGLVMLLVAGLVLWRPTLLSHAAPALLMPWLDAAEISPYRIEVSPGDTEVARGGDQLISAAIEGYDGDGVTLFTSTDSGQSWRQAEMTFGERPGVYESFLFDLGQDLQYYVTAAGQQSPVYRIAVADIPRVESIALRYQFPDYTKMPPELREGSGDIAALRGTRVEVLIEPNIEVPGGELLFDDGRRLPLERGDDGRWRAQILVEADAGYHVRLQRPSGIAVDASPEYRISALADGLPSVSILSPGRDVKVSMIEEPVMKIRASDDQGIDQLELVVSVNGSDEQVIQLLSVQARQAASRSVDAEHVIMLEQLGLRPGDLISYYVNARDRGPADAARTATSDMFFYQVRPFDASYRRADQGGGGGGGGQGQQQGGLLSEQQKQFVVATFKMIRDRASYDETSYQENLELLATAEARIRDRVEAIVRRISRRAMIGADERYRVITEELPLAAEKMIEVENLLRQGEIESALTDAQVALKHLQRADAVFKDINVSLSNRNGGGNGQNTGFEDLANLFQLEMDKLRNQYDTVQRGQQQRSGEAMIDETMEKLRQLAERQQREVERRLRALGQANDQSRARQLALAEELEEMARQLERLSRNQPNPALQQSLDRMRNAAEAMRQAAANGNRGDGTDQARRAAADLQEAQRLLDQSKVAQFGEALERTLKRAELVERKQDAIRREVAAVESDWGEEKKSQLKRLDESKQELSKQLANLEAELSELTNRAREQQPKANQALKQAIRAAREHRLNDRIGRTRQMLLVNQREAALDNEAEIDKGITRMRESIETAKANIGEASDEGLQRSLREMRALARELQYLRQQQGQGGAQQDETSAREGGQGGERQARRGENATREGGNLSADGQGGSELPRDFENFAERAGQLRGALISQGVLPGDIDPVLQKIEALADAAASGEAAAEKQAAAQRALMELEYRLRRQLESHEYPELLVSDPAQLPQEYRDMVADYFRSLSRQ